VKYRFATKEAMLHVGLARQASRQAGASAGAEAPWVTAASNVGPSPQYWWARA